ncbi:MAG: protein-glutamate O-methyltransferase CheR [Alphaproteobacteria bacterium]
MTPASFQFVCGYLKRHAGLVLTPDKAYLVESRLSPVARRLGHSSLDALTEALRAGRSPTLDLAVIEAMVTNETSFFRDKPAFDRLKTSSLPKLLEARANTKRLNIWCAAASTGQEPYSVAMMLKDMAPQLRDWRIDILGTDISPVVLEKARSGVYSQFEVQRGLPIQQLVRHFNQEGEIWRINADLRGMVRYRELNLLDEFSALGHFDLIFCRNVLIYFDRDTKTDILERLAKTLMPDGYLMLGAAESIIGLTDSLCGSPDDRGIYRLDMSPAIARKYAVSSKRPAAN